uniref:Uncharacterized protein n=2 Tax=Aegilops tauschii subsp. strangulata TaxID=200361 RepID=A0A453D270_AEGTS
QKKPCHHRPAPPLIHSRNGSRRRSWSWRIHSRRRRLPARRRASSGSSGGGLSPKRRGRGGGARARGGGVEEAQEDAGRWRSGGGFARATAVARDWRRPACSLGRMEAASPGLGRGSTTLGRCRWRRGRAGGLTGDEEEVLSWSQQRRLQLDDASVNSLLQGLRDVSGAVLVHETRA